MNYFPCKVFKKSSNLAMSDDVSSERYRPKLTLKQTKVIFNFRETIPTFTNPLNSVRNFQSAQAERKLPIKKTFYILLILLVETSQIHFNFNSIDLYIIINSFPLMQLYLFLQTYIVSSNFIFFLLSLCSLIKSHFWYFFNQ